VTIADHNFGNTSPLARIGSFPVYASTVLAALHAAAMVATALAMAAGAEWQSLQFSSAAMRGHFAVWEFVTYAFVHPPGLLFLLELYMLVVFGREIERFLGRRAFLAIYLTLLLLPPLVLTLASFAVFSPISYCGSGALHFGVFIAFATLYPAAEVFFGIQARWVAACLVAVSALQLLASRDVIGLGVLALDCGAAVLLVRRLRGGGLFPDFRSFFPARPSPHLHVVKRPGEEAASIDAILEKISRAGMRSLSAGERARLDRAREELLEKDRKR